MGAAPHEATWATAGVQAEFEVVQLGLAHDARKAEQQPIVVGLRVVQPLGVGDERLEQPAQLQQTVPIAVVARKPRRIQAHDQASLTQADLRDQPLEPVPLIAGRAGFAYVVRARWLR